MSSQGLFGVSMSQKTFWDLYIDLDLGKFRQRGHTTDFEDMIEEVSHSK